MWPHFRNLQIAITCAEAKLVKHNRFNMAINGFNLQYSTIPRSNPQQKYLYRLAPIEVNTLAEFWSTLKH